MGGATIIGMANPISRGGRQKFGSSVHCEPIVKTVEQAISSVGAPIGLALVLPVNNHAAWGLFGAWVGRRAP